MSRHTLRLRRAALAVSVVAICFSSSAFSAGRVKTDGLNDRDPIDGFIVAYRAGSRSKADHAVLQRSLDHAAATAFGRARATTLRHERTLGIGAEVVRAGRPMDRIEAETVMRQIAADPDVEYVEPDIRLYPTLTPNDTFFNLQYGFQSGVGGSNADQAWNLGFFGSTKIVAVIDTGITVHPDLSANILAGGYDFISNAFVANDGGGRDNNPADPGDWTLAGQCFAGSPATNSSWHGTHVSGTIAAVTNNATGVAGMAFQAKVLPVRVLGRCGGSLTDIIDAITWSSGGAVAGVPAVGANKAHVINMSLGGGGACSAAMQAAITGAVGRGTTVVVAAGNSNANVSGFTPASCANTIVVGATDSAGVKATFSNWGAGVDVSAPGVSIASTLNSGTTVPVAPNYVYYSGTSMAAPHVAGLVALMYSKPSPDPTPALAETIVKTWVKPFGAPPPNPIGTGIIDAFQAVLNTP